MRSAHSFSQPTLFAVSEASQIRGQFLLSVNSSGAYFIPLSYKAIHRLVLSKACHPDSQKSRKTQPTGVCNWHMEGDLVSEVSNCLLILSDICLPLWP